jgi:hypothetical protein
MLIERAAKHPVEDRWKLSVVGGNVEYGIEACKLSSSTQLRQELCNEGWCRQIASPIPLAPSLRHKPSLARLSSAAIGTKVLLNSV